MFSVIAATCLAASSAVGQDSAEPGTAADPATPRIDYRISPLLDLAMYLRDLAEHGDDATIPDIAGMAESVAAIRALAEKVGDRWGVFMGPMHTCEDASDVAELAERFPEQITLRTGEAFELRANTRTMADAIAAVEAEFHRTLWPERRTTIEQTIALLRQAIDPVESAIYQSMQQHLAAPDPQPVIPVYIVATAPWPGAMTYRARSGALCFVGVNMAEGSQMVEAVIHETIHAIDASTRGNVFQQLRAALIEAGIRPTDPRYRTVPHMVMFVHGGEVVRQHIDPSHTDYGELPYNNQAPLYERDAASVNAVRDHWLSHLRDEITREQAIEHIVAATVAIADRPDHSDADADRMGRADDG